MKKQIIIIIAFCSTLCSCVQSTNDNSIEGLTIDPSIKTEVEKYITPWEFGEGQEDLLIYNNRILLDYYKNDKLILSLKEKDNKSTVFKSFYYWQGDTLGIEGAFGLFGGSGFSIKIIKGKAAIYHMLASDDFPSYTFREKDSLVFRIEVPCTDTKIVISDIPDSTKHQIVYGYVEFKSGDYYVSSGSADGQELLPRKKERANMRIYFKSTYLDL
jgi:hypothetical protein